jgi:hypothetical protein
VDLTSPTTATVTFTSLDNGGNVYMMTDGSSADLNVNAAIGNFTVTGLTGTKTPSGGPNVACGAGVTCSISLSDTIQANQNVDGQGKFNLTIDSLASGPKQGETQISFTLTLTSGTWSSASNVLTPNGSGNVAAVHVGAFADTCNGTITASGACSNFVSGSTGFSGVPAPVVGAGLPGLIAACSGLIALCRRRRQALA